MIGDESFPQKKLSEITRQEWIIFQWQDITAVGDAERMFIRCFRRTPNEAITALGAWDRLAEEKGEKDGKLDV